MLLYRETVQHQSLGRTAAATKGSADVLETRNQTVDIVAAHASNTPASSYLVQNQHQNSRTTNVDRPGRASFVHKPLFLAGWQAESVGGSETGDDACSRDWRAA